MTMGTSRLAALAAGVGLLVASSPAAVSAAALRLPQAPQEQTLRTVYITAVDEQDRPVLDLLPADLVVKEDGREREVVGVEPARRQMQVAVIVDDNGTGLFRAAVADFVQRLLPYAIFSISTVTGQLLRLVDYTNDTAKLIDAIGYLGARPATPDGGQLLSGIAETARDLERREADRGVIVVLTVGGEEHSTLLARDVFNRLRDSRASLNVFSVTSALRATVPLDSSTMLETLVNINEVLGDGPKRSGGVREEFVGVAGSVQMLQRLAEQLPYQYRLTYALPRGVRPSERLEVTSRRDGVVVRAPTRVAR